MLDRTRWLRDQAPHKPAHLGEFGVADEKWALREEMKLSPELADFHNALWASALSGASGTAMFWWWERLDQRNAYPVYRPSAASLRTCPGPAANSNLPPLRALTPDCAWLVCKPATGLGSGFSTRKPHGPKSPWKDASHSHHRDDDGIEALPPGTYRVRWLDTCKGDVISEGKLPLQAGLLRLAVPDFDRDIACAISP